MLYTELDIPSVPESLVICDPDEVRKRHPDSRHLRGITESSSKTVYTTHDVNDELTNFLKQYFGDDVVVKYQVLEKDIPIHIDFGRKAAFNYLLHEGGDKVITRWYDKVKGKLEYIPKYEKRIPKFKWHKIDTSEYHTCTGITDKRLALTISVHYHKAMQSGTYHVGNT